MCSPSSILKCNTNAHPLFLSCPKLAKIAEESDEELPSTFEDIVGVMPSGYKTYPNSPVHPPDFGFVDCYSSPPKGIINCGNGLDFYFSMMCRCFFNFTLSL